MSERKSARIATSTPPIDKQEKKTDVSSVRQPIKLGNEGVAQIIRCLQSATKEVTDVLLYECNIIYECRVCKSLFRGLTNLLAHKRAYCLHHYSDPENPFADDYTPEDETTVIVQPAAPPPDPVPSQEWDNYIDSDDESVISTKSYGDGHKSTPVATAKSVIEQLQDGSFDGKSMPFAFYSRVVEKCERKQAAAKKSSSVVKLQEMKGTKAAVLQSMGVLGRTDLPRQNITDREVHEMMETTMESDSTSSVSKESFKENVHAKTKSAATLDSLHDKGNDEQMAYVEPCSPTGYINMSLRKDNGGEKKNTSKASKNLQPDAEKSLSSSASPLSPLSAGSTLMALAKFRQCDPAKRQCLKCKKVFSATATLLRHMKETHMPRRTATKCPLCDRVMSRSYAIMKHLKEFHHKTEKQVEQMKDQVYKKCVVVLKNKGKSNLLVQDLNGDPNFENTEEIMPKKTTARTAEKTLSENSSEPAVGAVSTKVRLPAKKTSFGKKARKSTAEGVAMKLGGGFRCFRCGTIFGKQDILEKHQQKCTASNKKISGLLSPTRPTATSGSTSADVENVFEKFQKKLATQSESPLQTDESPGKKERTSRGRSATPEPQGGKQDSKVKASITQSPKKPKPDGKKKSVNNKSSTEDLKKGSKESESGEKSGENPQKQASKVNVEVMKTNIVNTSKSPASPKSGTNNNTSPLSGKKKTNEKSVAAEKKQVSHNNAQGEKQGKVTENSEDKLEKNTSKEKQISTKSKKSLPDATAGEKVVKTTATTGQQNHSRSRSNAAGVNVETDTKSVTESTAAETNTKSLAQARSERLRARRRLSQGEVPSEDEKSTIDGATLITLIGSKRKRENEEATKALPSNSTRPKRGARLGRKETADGPHLDSMSENTSQPVHSDKQYSDESKVVHEEETSPIYDNKINPCVSQPAIKIEHDTSMNDTVSLVQDVSEEASDIQATHQLKQCEILTSSSSDTDLTAPHLQIRVLGSGSKSKLEDKIIVTVREPRTQSLSPEPKKDGLVLDYRKIGEGSKLVKGISKEDHRKILNLIDTDNLMCVKCGSKFRNSSNLHRHAVRHLGWRRYKCTICKGTFFNRSECRRHIRLIHERKMAVNLNTEEYIVDLEPDKVKTQSISMPRVEISLQRIANQQAQPSTSSTVSSPLKNEQMKGEGMYNISTRKTARLFDTSPYPREDSEDEPEEETIPGDLSSLNTRSGRYRKTSDIKDSAKATTLSTRVQHTPKKKAKFSSEDSNKESDKNFSPVSSAIGCSVIQKFGKSDACKISSGTKSSILTNVVAKPAFIIDSPENHPTQTKTPMFPAYKYSDNKSSDAFVTPQKDTVKSKLPKATVVDQYNSSMCSESGLTDSIVLRSPHQLGKQDWLSQVKDLPITAFGDIQVQGRQVVTIMNADGTVLGNVPVSVQKYETTASASVKAEENMMLVSEENTGCGKISIDTRSAGSETDISCRSPPVAIETCSPGESTIQSAARSTTHQQLAHHDSNHDGLMNLDSISAENGDLKDMDLFRSTQALLNTIQQDIPSESTLEDHEVAMATVMMSESGFSADDGCESSVHQLVAIPTTSRSEGSMCSDLITTNLQPASSAFSVNVLPSNQTVSLVTSSPGQLQYAAGDELLEMISSDQSDVVRQWTKSEKI